MASVDAPLGVGEVFTLSFVVRRTPNGRSAERQIRSLLLPLVVSVLAPLLTSAADIAVVGHLGVTELAAVSVGVAIFAIPTSLLQAIGLSHQIQLAPIVGGSARGSVSHSTAAAVKMCVSLALILVFLVALFRNDIVELFGVSPSVSVGASEWLLLRSFALIVYAVRVVLTAGLIVRMRAGKSTSILIASNVLNLAASIPLVFGLGGFKGLGLDGSALASDLADVVALVGTAYYWRRAPREDASTLQADRATAPPPSLAKVAISEIGSNLNLFMGELVFVGIVASAGELALSIGQICLEIVVLQFSLSVAYGTAIQVVRGRGSTLVVQPNRAMVLDLIGYGIVLMVLLGCSSSLIGRAFSSDPSVVAGSQWPLLLVAAMSPLSVLSAAWSGTLRAAGRSATVFWVNTLATWGVQIPVAWLMVWTLTGGVLGAFVGYAAYYSVKLLLSIVAARRFA